MNQVIYHKQTIEFIIVVKEFVNLCEIRKEKNPLRVAIYIQRILPLIYLKSLLLPTFENTEEELIEGVNEEEYEIVKNYFEELFGELDLDCTIPEFMSQNQEQTFAPLSELLTDIYQDLKNVLVNFQTGNENLMESALFVCKQNFEWYWGQRLLAASSALHTLTYDRKEDFDNIKPKKNKNLKDTDTSNWIINQIRHFHDS